MDSLGRATRWVVHRSTPMTRTSRVRDLVVAVDSRLFFKDPVPLANKKNYCTTNFTLVYIKFAI